MDFWDGFENQDVKYGAGLAEYFHEKRSFQKLPISAMKPKLIPAKVVTSKNAMIPSPSKASGIPKNAGLFREVNEAAGKIENAANTVKNTAHAVQHELGPKTVGLLGRAGKAGLVGLGGLSLGYLVNERLRASSKPDVAPLMLVPKKPAIRKTSLKKVANETCDSAERSLFNAKTEGNTDFWTSFEKQAGEYTDRNRKRSAVVGAIAPVYSGFAADDGKGWMTSVGALLGAMGGSVLGAVPGALTKSHSVARTGALIGSAIGGAGGAYLAHGN